MPVQRASLAPHRGYRKMIIRLVHPSVLFVALAWMMWGTYTREAVGGRLRKADIAEDDTWAMRGLEAEVGPQAVAKSMPLAGRSV